MKCNVVAPQPEFERCHRLEHRRVPGHYAAVDRRRYDRPEALRSDEQRCRGLDRHAVGHPATGLELEAGKHPRACTLTWRIVDESRVSRERRPTARSGQERLSADPVEPVTLLVCPVGGGFDEGGREIDRVVFPKPWNQL